VSEEQLVRSFDLDWDKLDYDFLCSLEVALEKLHEIVFGGYQAIYRLFLHYWYACIRSIMVDTDDLILIAVYSGAGQIGVAYGLTCLEFVHLIHLSNLFNVKSDKGRVEKVSALHRFNLVT
jgi:hypothetical protein